MSLTLVLSIIFIHFVADFIFQSDWQAKNKSKNNIALLSHVFNYTLVWYSIGVFYVLLNPNYIDWSLTSFVVVTFVAHTITDYITSRINSKLWAEGKVHYFFVSVGFDQVLHYTQLFGTYYLLTN